LTTPNSSPQQIFWYLANHHKELADKLQWFSKGAKSNSSGDEVTDALQQTAERHVESTDGKEVSKTNEETVYDLLADEKPWRSWIGAHFIPAIPRPAEAGDGTFALNPSIFVLRSGINFRYIDSVLIDPRQLLDGREPYEHVSSALSAHTDDKMFHPALDTLQPIVSEPLDLMGHLKTSVFPEPFITSNTNIDEHLGPSPTVPFCEAFITSDTEIYEPADNMGQLKTTKFHGELLTSFGQDCPVYEEGENVLGYDDLTNIFSTIPPHESHHLQGISNIQEKSDAVPTYFSADSNVTPPMDDFGTPAAAVCHFVSQNALVPPWALEIIHPLITHAFDPTFLECAHQGHISITNGINALSCKHQQTSELYSSPFTGDPVVYDALQYSKPKRRRLQDDDYRTTEHRAAPPPPHDVNSLHFNAAVSYPNTVTLTPVFTTCKQNSEVDDRHFVIDEQLDKLMATVPAHPMV
jgi:hypothetical protein